MSAPELAQGFNAANTLVDVPTIEEITAAVPSLGLPTSNRDREVAIAPDMPNDRFGSVMASWLLDDLKRKPRPS